jgi:hypothetical protein
MTVQRTPAARFALVAGAIYLVVAVLGFVLTGASGFAADNGPRLLGLFMINPLHNVVHLALATAWLVSVTRPGWSRIVNLAIGSVLGLVTVLGFAHVLTFLCIMSLGDPDNFLHLATACVALYFGSVGAESLERVASARHRSGAAV